MENYEKFLPIGTVVMLKGGKKRAMITGFCSIADDNKDKMYDYSGCIFPEGYLSSNQVCLFNHDQIEKVYHLGLVDDEEKLFKAKLDAFMKHLENSKNSNIAPETADKENTEILAETPSLNINVFQTAPVDETLTETNNDGNL